MAIKLKRYLKQTLVYWAKTATPDRFGKAAFMQPIEMKCRWDDFVEEFVAEQGRSESSKGVILLAPREVQGVKVKPVEEGGLVMESTLVLIKKLFTYPTVPTTLQGAFEVKQVKSTPSRKGVKFLYTVYL